MSKKKRIVILICCVMLLAVAGLIVTLAVLTKNKNEKQIADKYDTLIYENNMFDNDFTGYAGDFVYFYDYPSYFMGEYDVKNDKLIEIPLNDGFIDFMNFYNGDLYCVHASAEGELAIVKFDMNTGNYETIYTPPEGVDGLYNFCMTKSGLMFFNERRPTSEIKIGEYVEDEDGYRVNYTLYMYDPETKEKTPLTQGVENYYIRGNRIYFNRVHKSLQETVFYIDIDDPENVVDTGAVSRTLDAVNNAYSGRFYVDEEGKYLYYSGGTNEYKRRDLETGEEEIIFTYTDSTGYIARSITFNGKQILYVRCIIDELGGFAAKLYELDPETKESKLIWTDTLEELLGDIVSFKGNDEYYYLSTYPDYTLNEAGSLVMGNHCYLVYKDGTKKLMYDNLEAVRKLAGQD